MKYIKKIVIINFLFFIFFSCQKIVAEATDQELENKFLNQRANFAFVGKVIDKAGKELNKCTVDILSGKFLHTEQKSIEKKDKLSINGTFNIKMEDVSFVNLRFEKPGYRPFIKKATFLESLLERQKRIQQQLLKGEIKKEDMMSKHPYSFYKDMSYVEDNMVVVLKELQGKPVSVNKILQVLDAADKKKDSLVFNCNKRKDILFDIILCVEDDAAGGYRGILRSGVGGGIYFFEQPKKFHDILEAPLDGYNSEFNLSVVNLLNNPVFIVKTKDGFYIKCEIDGYLFNPEKGDARFILYRYALQEDHSRYLETIE